MNKVFRPTLSDSSGDELPSWGVSVSWESQGDQMVVRVWREDTFKRRGRSKTSVVESGNVEDALARVQVAARTLSARRLF